MIWLHRELMIRSILRRLQKKYGELPGRIKYYHSSEYIALVHLNGRVYRFHVIGRRYYRNNEYLSGFNASKLPSLKVNKRLIMRAALSFMFGAYKNIIDQRFESGS